MLAFGGMLLHAELPLSRGGRPCANILVPAGDNATIKYAAEELQTHVKMISGAEMPLAKADDKDSPAIVLSLGEQAFAADLKAIGDTDGYAIRQKANRVYIVAGKPKGILNGVYKLLFRNSDIIWARPDTGIGTIYTEDPNLTLKRTDFLDVPKFILRGWQMSGGKGAYASDVWQFRQGSNWSASYMRVSPENSRFGCVKEAGGGHNLTGMFITGDKYFDKHPEYFPFFKGVRQDPRKVRARTQLCFTNNEMTEEFKRILDGQVAENPDYEVYRIMIEDVWQCCECPECKKSIALPNGETVPFEDEAFRSTQFFMWLNKIAAHFKSKYPGKRILTFGYFFTA